MMGKACPSYSVTFPCFDGHAIALPILLNLNLNRSEGIKTKSTIMIKILKVKSPPSG